MIDTPPHLGRTCTRHDCSVVRIVDGFRWVCIASHRSPNSPTVMAVFVGATHCPAWISVAFLADQASASALVRNPCFVRPRPSGDRYCTRHAYPLAVLYLRIDAISFPFCSLFLKTAPTKSARAAKIYRPITGPTLSTLVSTNHYRSTRKNGDNLPHNVRHLVHLILA